MATFEDLLARMPAIAEAVNKFSSESVQRLALEGLLRSFTGDGGDYSPKRSRGGKTTGRTAKAKATGELDAESGKGKSVKTTKKRAVPVSLVPNLNLQPKDKISFRDFAATKAPKSNDERNTVAVYWLIHEAGLSGITPSHVYSVYKDVKWKVPPDLPTSMQITASTKRWLNTGDSKDIKLDIRGENLVEQELPRTPKKAKA
jgi:hypothetical protein